MVFSITRGPGAKFHYKDVVIAFESDCNTYVVTETYLDLQWQPTCVDVVLDWRESWDADDTSNMFRR